MTALLDQFRQQGFVLHRGFFPAAEVEALRSAASGVFARVLRQRGLLPDGSVDEATVATAMVTLFEQDLPTFIQCGKTCQHLVALHRFALQDRLLLALGEVGVAEPQICTRPVLYFNNPALAVTEGHYKTPPHQDWRSMQGSLNAVVAWVPLVAVDRPLGALEIIPGSHRHGLADTVPDDWYRRIASSNDAEFIPVEVGAGDLLLFSAFLIHRSGDNTTDAIRWSCHFRYNDLAEPTYIARGYPSPYVYRPDQELVTPDFPTAAELQAACDALKPGWGHLGVVKE